MLKPSVLLLAVMVALLTGCSLLTLGHFSRRVENRL